jgi:multidrug efflux system outer membrane protein
VQTRALEELPPPAVPAGVPAGLLARRPDLAEAERHLAAANERIGVTRAQLLPTFNIGASAGFESGQDSQLFESQSRALSVMGTVAIPIFEGGRNAANLRAAREQRDEALAAYRSCALNAFKEVENALSDLRQRTSQLADRDRATSGAREVLELTQKRYIEGAVSYFEVVDAQRSLLNAQLSRVQTLNARYTATIALVRALGGGWRGGE